MTVIEKDSREQMEFLTLIAKNLANTHRSFPQNTSQIINYFIFSTFINHLFGPTEEELIVFFFLTDLIKPTNYLDAMKPCKPNAIYTFKGRSCLEIQFNKESHPPYIYTCFV